MNFVVLDSKGIDSLLDDVPYWAYIIEYSLVDYFVPDYNKIIRGGSNYRHLCNVHYKDA